MNTIFEIWIDHEDYNLASQASYQAFERLRQLEGKLSRFIENSDVSRLNQAKAGVPVQVDLDVFSCIQIAQKVWLETNRAFDITVGPWLRSDALPKSVFRPSGKGGITSAMGTALLALDVENHTVTKQESQTGIDLGGIGKGYAVDRMASMLEEWELNSALIHGGKSTVLALDSPRAEEGWEVTISHPHDERPLRSLFLRHLAISGSGLRKGSHIIDPRSGRPSAEKIAVWSISSSATLSDALSTALMVLSLEEIKENRWIREQGTSFLLLSHNSEEPRILEI
jgi:thiamine biosynthesis lipoprotein